MELYEQGDKRKYRVVRRYREATFDDCARMSQGSHPAILLNNGNVGHVRITSIKRWKTRPRDLTMGLKYGLYQHSTIRFVDGVRVGGEILLIEEEKTE